MEKIISVEIKISIDDREKIGVENITTEAVKRAELDKAVTKEIIEALQDSLVEEMCGARYERNRVYSIRFLSLSGTCYPSFYNENLYTIPDNEEQGSSTATNSEAWRWTNQKAIEGYDFTIPLAKVPPAIRSW